MIRTAKYSGWDYKLDDDGGLGVFPSDIDKVEIPKFLGRYYGMQNHHLDAFCNKQFYLNQPTDFNDLLDSSLDLVHPDDFTIENFKRAYGKRFDDLVASAESEDLIKELKVDWSRTNEFTIGILCTTANGPCNELMWSYYTNNRGFYLDFETSIFERGFSTPRQMNYTPELIPINKDTDFRISNFVRMLVKNKTWQHENEWRFLKRNDINEVPFDTTTISGHVFSGQQRLVSWSEGSLKAIYLGFSFLRNFKFNKDGTFSVKVDADDTLYRFMRELVETKIPIYQICRRDFKLEPFKIEFMETDEVGTFRQEINYSEKPTYREL